MRADEVEECKGTMLDAYLEKNTKLSLLSYGKTSRIFPVNHVSHGFLNKETRRFTVRTSKRK